MEEESEKVPTHQLSIHLIKEQFSEIGQIVIENTSLKHFSIPISGSGNAELYVSESTSRPPKWAALFADAVEKKEIGTYKSISGLLVIKAGERYFGLSFGQGGRHLLQNNVCEERFGLLVTLNSVSEDSLQCIDKQSLDSLESQTRIQSGYATSADQFGIDVEQDMLKAVVGIPKDPALGKRMTGTDSLSVSVQTSLATIGPLLESYKTKFEEDLSSKQFDWVNNIALVRDADTIEKLESELFEKLNKDNYTDIWLAIPEIIDWESVFGFLFTNGKKLVHPDINLEGFLKTVDPEKEIDKPLLEQRRVFCVDSEHKKLPKHWSIFKCLYAEIDRDKEKFILNDGKWFKIDSDFVAKTNSEFDSIKDSTLELPTYSGGGEAHYNSEAASNSGDSLALMDKQIITHGGGQGKIEACDLFSDSKHLVHVKHYGKSSVLSHLIAQGLVSGQLLQLDAEFRDKFRNKLPAEFRELINVKSRPEEGEFTIVYAVISDAPGKELHLPFFTRVNMNNTRRLLEGFGYQVEKLKITVDPTYSKTSYGPPPKDKL